MSYYGLSGDKNCLKNVLPNFVYERSSTKRKLWSYVQSIELVACFQDREDALEWIFNREKLNKKKYIIETFQDRNKFSCEFEALDIDLLIDFYVYLKLSARIDKKIDDIPFFSLESAFKNKKDAEEWMKQKKSQSTDEYVFKHRKSNARVSLCKKKDKVILVDENDQELLQFLENFSESFWETIVKELLILNKLEHAEYVVQRKEKIMQWSRQTNSSLKIDEDPVEW